MIDESILEGYKAFVYIITNTINGKQYIGKKRLYFFKHKRLKGRKNRIKVTKASDWKDYWGSSDALKADVKQYGEKYFTREIVRLCKTLSEASYFELKMQMETDAILKPKAYYNRYVGGRISSKQMGVDEDENNDNC